MSKQKRNNSYNPPVRLKGETEHNYKRYYINFINTLTPEVAEKLKQLTRQCELLFGKFPHSSNNSDYEAQRKIHIEVWKITQKCVWSETRDYEGIVTWLDFLREQDVVLKESYEIQKIYRKLKDDVVKKLLSEKYDFYKSEYSTVYNAPPDEITNSDLDFYLSRSCYNWFNENNEIYRRAREIESAKVELLTQFQKAFDEVITKFCFEKYWMAESAFCAIWDGTGILQTERSYYETLDDKLISDIQQKLGIKDELHSILARAPEIPNHPAFVFFKNYSLFESFEDYEEQAVENYRQFIRNYLETINQSLKENGYKKKQGNHNDYSRVKWLVWWNIKKWDKDMIMAEIEKESRKEKEIGKEGDISTIDTAFRKFRANNLPIRKKGRN